MNRPTSPKQIEEKSMAKVGKKKNKMRGDMFKGGTKKTGKRGF
jgi:hypothetical protein